VKLGVHVSCVYSDLLCLFVHCLVAHMRIIYVGAGITHLVQRLGSGWTVESGFDSQKGQ
jgi:hypothetical protein